MQFYSFFYSGESVFSFSFLSLSLSHTHMHTHTYQSKFLWIKKFTSHTHNIKCSFTRSSKCDHSTTTIRMEHFSRQLNCLLGAESLLQSCPRTLCCSLWRGEQAHDNHVCNSEVTGIWHNMLTDHMLQTCPITGMWLAYEGMWQAHNR